MTKYKCNTDQLMYLTKGKIYECEPHKNGLHVWVTMDNGKRDFVHPSWFDLVEEHVIEVGSEWVSNNGVTWIVRYVNKYVVLNKDNMEICVGFEKFLDKYKPKPKTVTMHFYKDCKGLIHSYSEPMPVFGEHLFTKVIEL